MPTVNTPNLTLTETAGRSHHSGPLYSNLRADVGPVRKITRAALSDQQADRPRGSGSRPQHDGTRGTPRRGSSDHCRQEAPPRTAVGVAHVQGPAKTSAAGPNRRMRRTDGCAAWLTAGPTHEESNSQPCLDGWERRWRSALVCLPSPFDHPDGCRVSWCPRSRWSGIRRIVNRAIPTRASGTCRYAVLAQPTSWPSKSSHSSVVSPLVAASRQA